jgi:uncharacterized protein involved in exopolysaccharide biosynthesis
MSTTTRRGARDDVEVEDDVDLGRYWSAILARWWLPVLGLIAGALVGYVISLGGSSVWRAQSTIYLGQPLGGASSNTPVQSQQTNPSSVRQIVTSESVVQRVAGMVGEKPGQLRGRVSTSAVSGNVAKQGQAPLVTVTVTGKSPKKVRLAANELANTAVLGIGGYSKAKVTTLTEQIASYDRQLAALDRVSGNDATAAVLALRRGDVEQSRQTAALLLIQAQQVESPRVLTRAAAHKTTARTRRSTIAVAGLIGLLLGLAGALLWEPLASRVGRRPRV